MKIVADLAAKLQLGWNPFTEKSSTKAYTKMFDALDHFLDVKMKETEENTMRSYRSNVKIFKNWLVGSGFTESSYVCSFTESDAIDFMDDADGHISPRTYNNRILFFRVLFNWLVERKYIPANPFLSVKRKPKRLTGKVRRMFTNQEFARLLSWLEAHNVQYLVATLLCYCCFIRPKELAMLRCDDIDVAAQTVRIRKEVAKNHSDSSRTIPDVMMKYVRSLDLSHPCWYLFADHKGYDFSPGAEQVCSRKLAKYWSDCIRPALGFPMDLQFYSLKDTGITNMVNSGVPLTSVQQQADHSSLAITSIYVGKTLKASEVLKTVDIID